MLYLSENKEIQKNWSSTKIKYLKYLIISLILAPLGIWALFIHYFGVNVPWMDEYAIVDLLRKISENNFQISDLFTQHNEHRLFFPNLIMVVLSEISGLNTYWLMYFSFFLLILILLLLYFIFKARFKDIPLSLIWFVPISWFVFNVAQTFGILWGYELQVYLCIFGFFAALFCLDKSEDLDKWLIFALLGGILSTFSFFNGLLVWPIGFVLIYLTKKSKNKILIAWSLFTLISYVVFFYNWKHPSAHPSMFYLFQNPISSLEFFLVNVGCPIYRSPTIWSYILGVIVILTSIIVILCIIKRRLFQENAFFISILLFSLGSSFMITIGRAGFGISQATAPQYVSVTMMGILGLYLILLNLIFKMAIPLKFISILFVIVVFLIIIGIITGFIFGIPQAQAYHDKQIINEYKLINYNTIPLKELSSLYPNPNETYKFAAFLDNKKMSVFAPRDQTSGEWKGVYQWVSGQIFGEIGGKMSIGQTFYSPYSNLSSIDVIFTTYARKNTKNVMFHLRDSPESSIDLVLITTNASELQDNSYNKFKFPKISDSANKSYYFFIESPDSVRGNAIAIWSSKDDVYYQGTAYKQSKPIQGDLVFTANYIN